MLGTKFVATSGTTLITAEFGTDVAAHVYGDLTTVASHATTAPIWADATQWVDWTGTATTTDFPSADVVGDVRILKCAEAARFTAGADMLIQGVSLGSTITMAENDIVHVLAVTTSQFLLTIQKYDGTAIVTGDLEVGGNLLRNGSFELDSLLSPTAQNWTLTPFTTGAGGGSFTISDTDAHGTKSLAITSINLSNGGGYAISNEFIACGSGESYPWQAWVWAGGNVINVSGKVEMMWFNADKSSAGTTNLYTSANLPIVITLQSGTASAPATARYMKMRLTGGIGGASPPNGTAFGTVYFDGVQIGGVARRVRVRTLTSGTSYTPLPGVVHILVGVRGSTGGQSSARGGGGGAGYSERYYANPATTYSYILGAGGSTAGGDGGVTSFNAGAISVPGGLGISGNAGGASGATPTGGTLNVRGGAGGDGDGGTDAEAGGGGGAGSRAGAGGDGGNWTELAGSGGGGGGGTGGNNASGVTGGIAATTLHANAHILPAFGAGTFSAGASSNDYHGRDGASAENDFGIDQPAGFGGGGGGNGGNIDSTLSGLPGTSQGGSKGAIYIMEFLI